MSKVILITGVKSRKSDHMFMDPILISTVDFPHHSNFLWPEYVYLYSHKEYKIPNIN